MHLFYISFHLIPIYLFRAPQILKRTVSILQINIFDIHWSRFKQSIKMATPNTEPAPVTIADLKEIASSKLPQMIQGPQHGICRISFSDEFTYTFQILLMEDLWT